jgi:hypothetical protein
VMLLTAAKLNWLFHFKICGLHVKRDKQTERKLRFLGLYLCQSRSFYGPFWTQKLVTHKVTRTIQYNKNKWCEVRKIPTADKNTITHQSIVLILIYCEQIHCEPSGIPIAQKTPYRIVRFKTSAWRCLYNSKHVAVTNTPI